MTDRIYFRQLLAGRDFALANPVAEQMANFVYLIGDLQTRECVMVDPAWDVSSLLDLAALDQMKPIGALVTHYHPDHVGGSLFGYNIAGVANLMERVPVKVHVNKEEADGLKVITGLSENDLVRHESGDSLEIGSLKITFIHTPGHTPGSQCFLVDQRLVSGDTLFINGCGRVDLPGSDPVQMYESLTGKLAKLPDDVALYPGHNYADRPASTIGQEKQSNYCLRVPTLDKWLSLMGR
ncbi:MAG: MBL fold metallo-hydrolase [Acidobacteria bacterium]|nr:MBL fold metallo-hydrolase [Acidobacteriota bacterium]MBI3655654.1 MBL fold metallo-hydrolase [Acidobacteriota bacterium]